MPFTFLAHQAPVLPFARRSTRYVDITALVIGSTAPDFAFAFESTSLEFNGHDPWALLWWCIPFTLVAVAAIRAFVAPGLVPHLPSTRIVLPATTPRWWVTALCGLIGALTHLFLDAFTHRWGFAVEHLEVLRQPLAEGRGHTLYAYDALQLTGTALLSVFSLVVWFRFRAALPPRDPGWPRPTRASWACLVLGALLGAGLGLAAASQLTHLGALHSDIVRVIDATLLGFAIGCTVARAWMAPGQAPSSAQTVRQPSASA